MMLQWFSGMFLNFTTDHSDTKYILRKKFLHGYLILNNFVILFLFQNQDSPPHPYTIGFKTRETPSVRIGAMEE